MKKAKLLEQYREINRVKAETGETTYVHDELKKYYDDELVCYNEREIISKKGFVLVPDRLVFLNNKDVVIIDYKTGKEDSSHEVQMRKYQALLEEMNLKVLEKILIYVNEKIKISKCK